MRNTTVLRAFAALLLLGIVACSEKPQAPAPDRIFTNGVLYTANPEQRTATALAVTGERISYVGDEAGARALAGETTEVVDLQGRMLLPGLHDMHIHPMGIVDSGGCDLESRPMSLGEIAAVVRSCIEAQAPGPGEWLVVEQWNFAIGNQPDQDYSTLREALDAAAPDNPVILWGNDGHHGAVNSMALARAVNDEGVIVGIDRDSLASTFTGYRETIGVDASGRPNGELHETARDLVQPPPRRLLAGLSPEGMRQMARILAANGITSIMDAATPPESLDAYRGLQARDEMTFNVSAALHLDVDRFRGERGIDAAAMVEEAAALRAEFDPLPLIRVDTAKIFVDGVLEGNPLNDPPTLPNAAVVNPYQQPRFDIDLESGRVEITGYVDTASALCQKVREAMDYYMGPEVNATFRREFGYFPQQCRESRGVLENPEEFVAGYMAALNDAGFKVHAHVIGDRAVRTALDGFEALPGDSRLRHSLAHVQLVAPADYRRIGDLGLYLVFTYAWMAPELLYDITVTPFIDELPGIEALYDTDGYYMANTYPAAQLQALGARLAAGSDAPVDTRDPRPFYNIQQAVTRRGENGVVLNPEARIDITSALDAYTIRGAELFGHAGNTGSLAPGKYADLVIVDRDLLALSAAGKDHEIAGASVEKTFFRGRQVYP